MAALGQLGGPAQIPAMVDGVLAAEKGAERDAAERAVVLVCSRIPDSAQRAAPLLAAMDKLNPSDHAVLLSTLGRVGGPAALRAIETAISDPALHEAGVRALCNWPDASVATRLMEMFQADEHPEHRALALASLIRIAPLPDRRPDDERLGLLKKVMGLCVRPEDQVPCHQACAGDLHGRLPAVCGPLPGRAGPRPDGLRDGGRIAHHRDVRDANKAEFTAALDKVIEISKDPVVVDRANRYKAGKTWVRP